MERESGVTRRIIDAFHSSDIVAYQMEDESGFIGSIINDLNTTHIE